MEHYSRFDATPGKRDTLRAWTKDFFNNQLYDLKFPALQNLTLDFQAMKFDEKAGFRVHTLCVVHRTLILTVLGRSVR